MSKNEDAMEIAMEKLEALKREEKRKENCIDSTQQNSYKFSFYRSYVIVTNNMQSK